MTLSIKTNLVMTMISVNCITESDGNYLQQFIFELFPFVHVKIISRQNAVLGTFLKG